MMRLDKYLAEMGVGTRQEVKKQIRQGKAAVNGTVVKAADTKIDETCDEVTISGRNISYVSYEYYMLNKPAGVVSATEDRRDTTVIDLIKDKIPADQYRVLNGVRRLGNIGAHMEKDVNLIVDIDPGEAQKLVKLLELLLKDWYIARHEREELYREILVIDEKKQDERHPG